MDFAAASRSTRLLTRHEIEALMRPRDYLEAVELGFRCLADGAAQVPAPLCIASPPGAFHAKGARAVLDRAYVAVKLNGNFPDNPQGNGRPTIQGVIVLCDAEEGSVLAVMDSIEITLRRTAAASALAARYLARPDASEIAICGCGEQGRAQLTALAEVLPIERGFAWDRYPDRAESFAREMGKALRLDVTAVTEVCAATQQCAVIVTATTARTPFLTRAMVAPGSFIAAVGADSTEKSELAPDLMADATIVADVLEQSAAFGDLHHAIEAGLVTRADVHAELSDLVVGRKAGRRTPAEITIFDSTGTAIEDVASAAWIYERAITRNAGSLIDFGAARAPQLRSPPCPNF